MSNFAKDILLEEIDTVNLSCYDRIAIEYDSESHETCKDFDIGTACLLDKARRITTLKKGFNYLDVGVGTGRSLEFIMPWLEEMNANIEVLDISSKMIDKTKEKFGNRINSYHITSIHNFVSPIKYDLIVAALCDPFLTTKSIETYKKVVSEDGIIMMTLPTRTWASRVRGENIDETIFHDDQGNKFRSYSFCWSKGDLIKTVESYGFICKYAKVLLVEDVRPLKGSISKINQNLLQTDKKTSMTLSLIFLNN